MDRFSKMKGIAFLCSVLLVGGFIIGYIATYERPDRLHKLDISRLEGQERDKQEEIEMPVDRLSRDKITPNTRLIFKTEYTECGHTVVERKKTPAEIVNLDKEELARYYQNGWEIDKFSSEEVVLTREITGICPEHFLLGVQDGYVAVYGFNEDGKPELKEITDIPISILRLNDQNNLRKGILVDSMEEVDRLLEEFSS